jgi:hypothetical protein
VVLTEYEQLRYKHNQTTGPLNEEEVFWQVYRDYKALGAKFHTHISFVDFMDIMIKYDQRLHMKRKIFVGSVDRLFS